MASLQFLDNAPATAVDADGSFNFGRYRTPLSNPDFAAAHVTDFKGPMRGPHAQGLGRFLRSMRLKEWHYHSVVNDDWFLGFAVAQLGYLCNVFLYLVDRKTGQKLEYSILSPLGQGLQFAAGSLSGKSEWKRGEESLSISYDVALKRWIADIKLPLNKQWLSGRVEIERDECMALVYPLGENRAAYTHKEAGNRAQGHLRLGDVQIDFKPGEAFGAMDWTRSFANRLTSWNWLCVAGLSTTGRRLGLNLSARVYEDQENCLWLDGVAHPLGAARFKVPENAAASPDAWHVDADGLNLEFVPKGYRGENVQLGIIASRFVQKYGVISGRITVDGQKIEINRLFGVVEDHFAFW